MSSKKGDMVALVPGSSGWEIWTGPPGGPFVLAAATGLANAGEIDGLPAGDMVMVFPARAVTSVPFHAATTDGGMFGDLATMHLERIGLRPDALAGQLVDTFVIAERGDGTDLAAVVLKAPAEGDLPRRSPKEFEVSARVFPLPREGVALWREFGRWVFALSSGGRMVYLQATTSTASEPDPAVVSEVRLAMTQLALQGMGVTASEVVVWEDESQGAAPPALEGAFPRRVQVAARPAPVLPEPRSKLLPEDVRAARRVRARKQQQIALVAALVLVYAGLFGWQGYGLWRDSAETKRLEAEARSAQPEAVAYETHRAKWSQLGPVVDGSQWPVELLLRVASQLPANGAVRFKSADIGGREIKLTGESAEPGPISQFSLALSRSVELRAYKWENAPPEQTNKGNWNFSFTGTRIEEAAP